MGVVRKISRALCAHSSYFLLCPGLSSCKLGNYAGGRKIGQKSSSLFMIANNVCCERPRSLTFDLISGSDILTFERRSLVAGLNPDDNTCTMYTV